MQETNVLNDKSEYKKLRDLLLKNGKHRYVEELAELDSEQVRDLLKRIWAIHDHYTTILLASLGGGVKSIQLMLDGKRDTMPVESITHRIKDAESLKVKIATKTLDAMSGRADKKYIGINEGDYHTIITDLIGFRLVCRFPQEWENVDISLRGSDQQPGIFEDNPDKYVRDWTEDNPIKVGTKPFLVEKPKWYYLVSDSTSLKFPIEDDVEAISSDRFDAQHTTLGYRSIHYVVNFEGKYAELQLRTIAEHAWAECEHETVYKSNLPDGDKKDLLSVYAKLYANLIVPITEITKRMYALTKSTEASEENSLHSIVSTLLYVTGNLVENLKLHNRTGVTSRPNNPMESTPNNVAYDANTAAIYHAGDYMKILKHSNT